MAEKLPKNVAVELDDDMCIEVQAQHIHAGTIDGTAEFGINAKLVADAGKACALALGSKDQDLRFTCTGELKPILFTNLRSDDTARVRGLIMPVHI